MNDCDDSGILIFLSDADTIDAAVRLGSSPVVPGRHAYTAFLFLGG